MNYGRCSRAHEYEVSSHDIHRLPTGGWRLSTHGRRSPLVMAAATSEEPSTREEMRGVVLGVYARDKW